MNQTDKTSETNRDDAIDAALRALEKSDRTGEESETPAETEKDGIRDPVTDFLKGVWGRVAQNSLAAKVIGVTDVFWNKWARPVTQVFAPILRATGRFYRWAYAKFAYKKEQSGARVFSKNRAAAVTLGLAVSTFLVPYVFFFQFVPLTMRTVYDAGMLSTLRQEELFLGRAELIEADRDLFQVMGCHDISGCEGGDNTMYFRLRPNVIMSVKYWTTRFEPYDPAEIAGAMVSELNKCKIEYYGRRVKALGWYPYIVSASCVPA